MPQMVMKDRLEIRKELESLEEITPGSDYPFEYALNDREAFNKAALTFGEILLDIRGLLAEIKRRV